MQFSGSDNFSSSTEITVLDLDSTITLTDQAGNNTVVTLKDKSRKQKMSAEIKSLSYNRQLADVSKNKFVFSWALDKQGNVSQLTQRVRSNKDFNIDALYKNNQTQLSGKDQNGKINKIIPGLVLLKVVTSTGDLSWNY